jgi:fructosamine-3-kinase
MILEEVQSWLRAEGYGEVVVSRAVGGGCINAGARLQTTTSASFFLKVNSSAPPDMFAREAEGLLALKSAYGPRIPLPYLHGAKFILMEDLAPVARQPDYWEKFGRSLAALHNQINPRFGFANNNYIGSTPQSNTWMEDGFNFFAEQRLIFQARLAVQAGRLTALDLGKIEWLAARLPELVPHQPASLIHGDLWSGNALTDADGAPALIDPAAHYGWAEAELAMTTLFGSFPSAFYTAYQEVRPLPPGLFERFPLYNLYHLLNHLNLFGGGYLGAVKQVLGSFM